MNIKDNKIYSNVSQSFSLIRCGASNLLSNEKSWNLNGELVNSDSPDAFTPAYTIHELLNIKLKNTFESPITGNSKNDICYAVSMIMSEMMKINKMPFRVWNHDSYMNCNGFTRPFINHDGRLVEFKASCNGMWSEIEVSDLHELEIYSGYDDKFGVLIFEKDAVLINDKICEVKKIDSWQLYEMENHSVTSLPLTHECKFCTVLGTSRLGIGALKQISMIV